MSRNLLLLGENVQRYLTASLFFEQTFVALLFHDQIVLGNPRITDILV